jgi:hypothetical protein
MNRIRSGYSGVRLIEIPETIKFVIIMWYVSLSLVIFKIILFFSWLLDNVFLSLGFSSASSASCSDIYNIILKISAIKASGVKKYIPRNLFSGVGEVSILESKKI